MDGEIEGRIEGEKGGRIERWIEEGIEGEKEKRIEDIRRE